MKKISSVLFLLLVTLFSFGQNVGTVELQKLNGGKTTPQEWVDGKTPYVVSFWFVACKNCIDEMDAITDVYEKWQEEAPFRYYAVCTDDSRSLTKAMAMVRSRGWAPFEFVFDSNRELSRAMKVSSCPYVFLYDKNGRLVYSHLGYSPGDEEILFKKIRELE